MTAERQSAHRLAFYVRVWQEGQANSWRGSVQQAGSDQVRYFQRPADLAAILHELCGWPVDSERDREDPS